MTKSPPLPPAAVDAPPPCDHCLKPPALCVCEGIEPIDNRIGLLVLQHPQEQDRLLGTARLATLQLAKSDFRVGLSWPSLSKALGRDADPYHWAVLHLGSATGRDLPNDREVVALDKKGDPLPDQDRALDGLRGLIVFDGTWSQAKTLWWRNAWILKVRRIALNPKQASLYGKLRREPRREGLSTIEAAGLAISRLEGRPDIEATMRGAFNRMLIRYRAALANGDLREEAAGAGAAAKKRDWRRRRPQGPAR